MKVRDKTRTSAEARVPTTQSTSKNHNYFYTHRNEVIQKLKFSLRCLVSRKKYHKNTNSVVSNPEKSEQ